MFNRPAGWIDRRRLIGTAGATALVSVLPRSPGHAQAEPRTIAPVAGLGQAPHGGGFFFIASGFSLARDGSALITAAKWGSFADVYEFASDAWVASLPMEGIVDAHLVGNGERAVTAGKNAVMIWDVATAKTVRTIPVTGADIEGVAVAPDGRVLAISQNGTISLWDLGSGARLTSRDEEGSAVRLAFSPDGKRLACAYPGLLQVYDPTSPGLRALVVQWRTSLSVGGLVFSEDSRLIVLGEDERVRVFDLTTKRETARIDQLGPERSFFSGIAAFRNGQMLAAGDSYGHFLIGDVGRRAFIARSADPPLKPGRVAISPDQKRAYVWAESGEVAVFDLASLT